MMRSLYKYILASTLTIVSMSSFAQTGSIAGYIDGEWLDGTVERMPMVKVELLQGGQVVQTVQSDFDGLYRFDVVEPGEYELAFSSIGYDNDTVKEVRVQYGRRTVVDVQLEEKEDTVEPLDCLFRAKGSRSHGKGYFVCDE